MANHNSPVSMNGLMSSNGGERDLRGLRRVEVAQVEDGARLLRIHILDEDISGRDVRYRLRLRREAQQ